MLGIWLQFFLNTYKSNLLKKILKYVTFMILGSVVSIYIGRKYDYIFGFNASSLTSMFPAVIASKNKIIRNKNDM